MSLEILKEMTDIMAAMPKVIPCFITMNQRTADKVPKVNGAATGRYNPAVDSLFISTIEAVEVIIDNDASDGNFFDISRYVDHIGRSQFYEDLNENKDLCLVNAYKYEMENPK
jgi:hypothetical protein